MSKTFPVTMGRTGIQMIEKLPVYDFVWGMTNINRFTGKSDRLVNVAAHCLHCLELATIWQPDNTDLQFYALVHDLPEAYYGDFPGFLKSHLGAEFIFVLEKIDDTIFNQLGLSKEKRIVLHDDLKTIDENALALEAEYAFDKFESYHWPKPTIYEKLDILNIYTVDDTVGVYNSYITNLESFGNDNEVLRSTLHGNQPYSHPVRVR